MQLTGDIDWHDDEAEGTGRFDHRKELATFGSVPTRVTTAHDRRSADFLPEREMYFDMDIALPFHWESMTGKGHKLSKSTDSQEFEFSMSVDPAEPVEKEISPADDLFYKGQLLPLHLPKRLQMVQKLSSPKQTSPSSSSAASKGDPSAVTVSCFFQPSSLKYSALGLDESYLGSALVNSRSSSFHSQGSNNFWESDSPGDIDSGDSSSSRDSSGSSQDACVPDKQNQGAGSFKEHIAFSGHCCSKDRGFLQQREFFANHNLRSEKSLFSSWLRTPFKWKVLFGLKRNSKSSKSEDNVKTVIDEPSRRCSSDHHNIKKKLPRSGPASDEFVPGSVTVNFPRSSRATSSLSFGADQKLSSRKEFSSSSASSTTSSSSARAGSGCGASASTAGELPHSGSLFLFPPSDHGFAKEKFDSSERSVSASKARESLHKYLNILKPLNVKGPQRTADTSDLNTYRMVDIRATTFSGNLTASPKHSSSYSAGLPSPKAAFAKSMSSPKPSFSEKRSPVMHSLSGNLRVPSFSRSSKASMTAGSVAKAASPNHSGALPCSSPSAMAELHSAIQGAIAHCKQSQSKSDCK
ncbi:hypothetical protein Mapa_007397 [Marchantia paleacea]|nr:hypothetical protein Mapa_007397 [Marchantia paleacea]